MLLFYHIEFQVFLTIDPKPSSRIPIWMVNDRVESDDGSASGWQHLPFEVQHPFETPAALRGRFSVVLRQTGPPEGVVFAAVKHGCFLTVGQLKLLHGVFRFPMVSKPNGHGKDGGVVKRDWADALIKFLFPDANTKDQWDMLQGIMGKNWKHLKHERVSRHSAEILTAFNGMDREDLRDFVDLVQVAADEEVLKEKRDRTSRPKDIMKSNQKHATPDSLRNLTPQEANCRISRHPGLKRYQSFYHGTDSNTGSLDYTVHDFVIFCVSTDVQL